MSEGSTADDAPDADGTDTPPTERKLRRALTQIRREGLKVAAIYAVVDAALATLLVNLVVTVAGAPGLPTRLPIPDAVLDALAGAGATPAEPTVSSAAVVGAAAGLLVFLAEVGWRVRQPLVEQFAAANPSLSESLRTARDAVERDRQSRIVLRLYEDVLDQLRDASSIGLLSTRRVALVMLLVSVISIATIQLAVVDISLSGLGGPAEPEGPDGGTETEYEGLQDGSSILGEAEDVPEGSEDLEANIDTSGSGSGNGTEVDSAAYRNSGLDSSSPVESQRAGFDERERLEDAELIREYNLRIREDSESDS